MSFLRWGGSRRVCHSDIAAYPNVLARAAFQVINSGWRCEPGAVFPGVVSAHLETALSHLFLTPPFLWEDELTSRVVGDKTVAWPLALPISEGEAANGDRGGRVRPELAPGDDPGAVVAGRRPSTIAAHLELSPNVRPGGGVPRTGT